MRYKFLAVLFLCLPFIVNAQIISNYGLKIGVVSSKASDLSSQSYYSNLYRDSRISGSFGIFAQFLSSDYLRFEMELSYKQEGAEDKIPVTTSENPDGTGQFIIVDHAYDFLSFNISLQPKYETKDICLFAIISPSLNYMLKNRDQILLTEDINKLVFGYNIGFGFQPKSFLNGNLFLEVRYGGSFSKYLKNDYLEAKFNTLQFSIGSYIN
ncbi:MAG: PorT family protein [Bacteroidetes bacterium]|nr:PorT family protein [Bacteroidota bacterium]